MRMIFSYKYGIIGLVILCGGLALVPALDEDHAGPARVIDADTIAIGGERYRFYGVDAVEIDQTCHRRDGAEWPCGREAAAALAAFVVGLTVNCDVRGGDLRDTHGRFVSICYAGSDDLAAWIAQNGWAIADRGANRLYNYTNDEGMAKFLRKGIWDGSFDPPADWRSKHP